MKRTFALLHPFVHVGSIGSGAWGGLPFLLQADGQHLGRVPPEVAQAFQRRHDAFEALDAQRRFDYAERDQLIKSSGSAIAWRDIAQESNVSVGALRQIMARLAGVSTNGDHLGAKATFDAVISTCEERNWFFPTLGIFPPVFERSIGLLLKKNGIHEFSVEGDTWGTAVMLPVESLISGNVIHDRVDAASLKVDWSNVAVSGGECLSFQVFDDAFFSIAEVSDTISDIDIDFLSSHLVPMESNLGFTWRTLLSL